jgi:GT2 family glycosyltransferase
MASLWSESAFDPRLDIYASDNLARVAAITPEAAPSRPLKARTPGLSIIILTLDRFDLMAPLLDSLIVAKNRLKATIDIDIIVGDTGSTEPNLLALYDQLASQISVVRNMAYQFSRCNNALFDALAEKDLTLFLNNDVIFPDASDALAQMVAHLRQSPKTGTLGAVLHYPNGNCQHAGIAMIDDGPLAGLCFHPGHAAPMTDHQEGDIWPVMGVTGACLMIRSDVFVATGGFDEAYRTECQDVALCLAARRHGYSSEIMHVGKIVHLENATRPQGSEDWQDRQRFVRKWRSFMEAIQ